MNNFLELKNISKNFNIEKKIKVLKNCLIILIKEKCIL